MRNFRVFHLLGITVLFLSAAMLPAGVLAAADRGSDLPAFISAFLVTAAIGAATYWFFLPSRHSQLSLVENFSLVTLVWLAASLFGALPYHFYGLFGGNFLDAFFESVSGFTTTGSTMIRDIEILPRGIILWRSLTQWLGGMGIIVLFLAALPRFGFKGMTLFKAELPGPLAERVVPRVAETARKLWLIYVAFTVLQAILLMLSGVSLFDSVNHALTTMPTGGFSPYNKSITSLNNPTAEIIIIIFMLIAGANFVLYFRLLRGDLGALKNQELHFYLGVLIISVILITLNLGPRNTPEFFTALRQSAFQVVSITTTTGYSTADFDAWPYFSRALLFFLMFVGACGGSTGGGLKQIRLMLIFKYAIRELNRLIHPSAVSTVKLNDEAVPEEMLRGVIGFSALYLFFFVFSTLALCFMGLDFITAASAVATTLGNVGPGLGLVGPLHTFQIIPDAGTFLLTMMMILGRLEIYTVLILFLPESHRLWHSYAKKL